MKLKKKCEHAFSEDHVYCLKCGESRVTTTKVNKPTTKMKTKTKGNLNRLLTYKEYYNGNELSQN